eukprot:scaffold176832_cov35-Tisochrysis_lutea.AAC.9
MRNPSENRSADPAGSFVPSHSLTRSRPTSSRQPSHQHQPHQNVCPRPRADDTAHRRTPPVLRSRPRQHSHALKARDTPISQHFCA